MLATKEFKSGLMRKSVSLGMWPCDCVSARRSTRKPPAIPLIDQTEKLKAVIQAKVEYPFRAIKRQFGFVKARFRGLKKITA